MSDCGHKTLIFSSLGFGHGIAMSLQFRVSETVGHGSPCPEPNEEEINAIIVLIDFNKGIISAVDY